MQPIPTFKERKEVTQEFIAQLTDLEDICDLPTFETQEAARQYLSGLTDADGSIDTYSRLQITSVDAELIRAAIFALWLLGAEKFAVYIKEIKADYRAQSYDLKVSPAEVKQLNLNLHCHRKQQRLAQLQEKRTNKVTPARVREAQQLKASGMKTRELQSHFGVSRDTVKRWLKREAA